MDDTRRFYLLIGAWLLICSFGLAPDFFTWEWWFYLIGSVLVISSIPGGGKKR